MLHLSLEHVSFAFVPAVFLWVEGTLLFGTLMVELIERKRPIFKILITAGNYCGLALVSMTQNAANPFWVWGVGIWVFGVLAVWYLWIGIRLCLAWYKKWSIA